MLAAFFNLQGKCTFKAVYSWKDIFKFILNYLCFLWLAFPSASLWNLKGNNREGNHDNQWQINNVWIFICFTFLHISSLWNLKGNNREGNHDNQWQINNVWIFICFTFLLYFLFINLFASGVCHLCSVWCSVCLAVQCLAVAIMPINFLTLQRTFNCLFLCLICTSYIVDCVGLVNCTFLI